MYEGKQKIIDPIERVKELEYESAMKELKQVCMDRDNMKQNLRDAEEHIRDMNTHIAVLRAQVDLVHLIFGGC